jgi:hypothetical protein
MNFTSKQEKKIAEEEIKRKILHLIYSPFKVNSKKNRRKSFPLGGMRNVNFALFKFFAYLFTIFYVRIHEELSYVHN